MFTSSNAYITKYYDTVHQPSVLFINSFLASCISPLSHKTLGHNQGTHGCHTTVTVIIGLPLMCTNHYNISIHDGDSDQSIQYKRRDKNVQTSYSEVNFCCIFFIFWLLDYNLQPTFRGLALKQCLDVWALSRSEPTFIWNNQLELICHEIHSENEYIHFVSRPGQSQGLLYKPLRHFIDLLSQSSFSSNSFTAPPRPSG